MCPQSALTVSSETLQMSGKFLKVAKVGEKRLETSQRNVSLNTSESLLSQPKDGLLYIYIFFFEALMSSKK